MRDRWDEEEERLRGRLPEPEPEPTLGEAIDAAVRKITTTLIIAAGLIAAGLWSSGRGGGDTVPDYQIVAASDGRVYRLDTDSGRVIACQGAHCWDVLHRGQDVDDDPPADAAPKQNAVAAQPAPTALPAPQNATVAAPAPR